MWGLWNTDDARVGRLLEIVSAKFPEAFGPEHSHYLWRNGMLFPGEVRLAFLSDWLASGDPQNIQLVGEFAVAARMLDPDDIGMRELGDRMLSGELETGRVGALFALAAIWRQNDEPDSRVAAHAIIAPLARTAEGQMADAISSALDFDDTLQPDEMTREMLQIASGNPKLLRACLNRQFAEALQELLHHPTFDLTVLDVAEKVVELLFQDPLEHMSGLLDQDFVTITIALQRSGGEQRTRAMNLYERLLDAGNHFAGQAAKDSIVRA